VELGVNPGVCVVRGRKSIGATISRINTNLGGMWDTELGSVVRDGVIEGEKEGIVDDSGDVLGDFLGGGCDVAEAVEFLFEADSDRNNSEEHSEGVIMDKLSDRDNVL
jgi:hypothetical protein